MARSMICDRLYLHRRSLGTQRGNILSQIRVSCLVERAWLGPKIEGNGTGIFSREGSSGTLVRGNNFLGNVDYHVKLGELQGQDVDAGFNYWGSTVEREIENMLFDKKDAAYLGRVRYTPFETDPFPLGETGTKRSRSDGEMVPGGGSPRPEGAGK